MNRPAFAEENQREHEYDAGFSGAVHEICAREWYNSAVGKFDFKHIAQAHFVHCQRRKFNRFDHCDKIIFAGSFRRVAFKVAEAEFHAEIVKEIKFHVAPGDFVDKSPVEKFFAERGEIGNFFAELAAAENAAGVVSEKNSGINQQFDERIRIGTAEAFANFVPERLDAGFFVIGRLFDIEIFPVD